MTNYEGLTHAELSGLRAALLPRARDARKKAITAIMAEAELKDAWNKYMAPTKEADPEQKTILRQASRDEFESKLAGYPDAYCKQLVANLFVEVEGSIQKEMMKRSALRTQKGTK